MSQTLWFFFAFVIVLALIGVAAWLVRRFGGSSLGSSAGRGRMPRLAVIDAAAVDGRRRLVLVRRDNVEHLLMIGGPADLVVEPNIVRSMPQRDQAPPRAPAGTELPPRLAPDTGWSDSEVPHTDPFEHREPPMPELPPRTTRTPYPEDARRAAPQMLDRNSPDMIPSFTPEPMIRPEPALRPDPALRSEPRAIPRSERTEPLPPRLPRASDAPKAPSLPPRPPARPAEAPLSSADQNLADMAQRLEAALRRPGGEMRLDTPIGPIERPGAPPSAPEPTGSRPVPRAEGAPRPVAPPPPPPPPPPAPKAAFENLEDEMANLLGRPKPPA
ncbi:MAG TPA: flagellar biosynthetic protein FliO [Afipia sp.]